MARASATKRRDRTAGMLANAVLNHMGTKGFESLAGNLARMVDAYVAGVNAFISTHHGSALPPEFTLLRFEPEPFTGPDVLVWVKMMAWDLSANYSSELLRHDLQELGLALYLPPPP